MTGERSGQPVKSGPGVRAALIGAIALAASLGLLAAVWLLARPIALLFAAVVIAQALAPPVALLERRVPRVLAVVLVYLALIAALGIVAWLIVPMIVAQAQSIVDDAPALVEQAQRWIARMDLPFDARALGAARSSLIGFGLGLVTLPLTLLSAALDIALVSILSLYWLISMPDLRRWVLSLAPEDESGRISDVLEEVGRTIGGYVRSAALDALILFALAYAGYLLIGLRYPLLLALITGLSTFVPIVGVFVAAIPALGVALLDSPGKALVVLGFYIALQQLEGNVLLPYIVRKQAAIPPVLAIFALMAGAALGGILGALVAIPLSGALRVLVLDVAAPAIRRWTGASRPSGAEPREPVLEASSAGAASQDPPTPRPAPPND